MKQAREFSSQRGQLFVERIFIDICRSLLGCYLRLLNHRRFGATTAAETAAFVDKA
jgi:hypothetical protein